MRLAVALAVLLAVGAIAAAALVASPATATPVGQTPPYAATYQDRSFKLDLLDTLAEPPQLVIFGGSRATRFEPSFATTLTGKPAMNLALSNFRPEDAWAILRHLYAESADRHLSILWGLTANALTAGTIDPGLVRDERLAAAFPAELIAQEAASATDTTSKDRRPENHVSARGFTLWNIYDAQRASGLTLDANLDRWIAHYVTDESWSAQPATQARSYLEQTLALLNRHGVTPCLVLMPYHPRALAALNATEWRWRQATCVAYLRALQLRYSLRLLDCTSVAAFGGSASAFYDGAHISVENARTLMAYAVRAAPECFE
jgi:hypothetical protein